MKFLNNLFKKKQRLAKPTLEGFYWFIKDQGSSPTVSMSWCGILPFEKYMESLGIKANNKMKMLEIIRDIHEIPKHINMLSVSNPNISELYSVDALGCSLISRRFKTFNLYAEHLEIVYPELKISSKASLTTPFLLGFYKYCKSIDPITPVKYNFWYKKTVGLPLNNYLEHVTGEKATQHLIECLVGFAHAGIHWHGFNKNLCNRRFRDMDWYGKDDYDAHICVSTGVPPSLGLLFNSTYLIPIFLNTYGDYVRVLEYYHPEFKGDKQ